MSYLELFVAVIGGSHWMCMIQMKCMSVILSDQQAVYHVSVDVAHNHSKSIFLRKNSLVKWIKNGAFLVHQNISKSLEMDFAYSFMTYSRTQNAGRDLIFVLEGRNCCGVEKIRLYNGMVSEFYRKILVNFKIFILKPNFPISRNSTFIKGG